MTWQLLAQACNSPEYQAALAGLLVALVMGVVRLWWKPKGDEETKLRQAALAASMSLVTAVVPRIAEAGPGAVDWWSTMLLAVLTWVNAMGLHAAAKRVGGLAAVGGSLMSKEA